MRYLDSISVFSAIAEEGAISRAARKLNISTATASAHLDIVEAHLGGKLFVRSTRQLVLTDLGRLYLEEVQPILEKFILAERMAKSYQMSPQGSLKITTSAQIGRLCIAPIVAKLSVEHPKLNVHLDLNNHCRELLRDGYDVGIRVGESKESSLIQRKLVANQHVLVASPDYLASAPPLNVPEDLSNHRLLLQMEETDSPPDLRFSIDNTPRVISFESSLSSNNSGVLRNWAIDGHGIAYKSLWEVADAIAEGSLSRLLEPYEAEPTDIFALSPFKSGECKKVDTFIDFVRSQMNRALARVSSTLNGLSAPCPTSQ